MQLRIRNELLLVDILVVVFIVTITLITSSIFRLVLAFPFLLFFPGYALVAALFPRRGSIDTTERVALSFGMSIVIVPLIGLILNYSPWGIKLQPALYSVSSFIFVTSIIAWLRRRRFPESERFSFNLQWRLPVWGSIFSNKVLSAVLIVSIFAALGILGYVIAAPKTGEKFSEFYVLDTARGTTQYPQEISADMAGNVVLGIVNHEYHDVTYHIKIRASGVIVKEVGPVDLQHEQKWEQKVDFIPVNVGENQKAEFLLFKEGESDPYRSLYLWINVTERK